MKYVRKILYFVVIIFFLSNGTIVFAATAAKPVTPATWKPKVPEGYVPITWAKARGVASFIKIPNDGGFLDYLTFIYLPYNQIKFISSSTPRTEWGLSKLPLVDESIKNWAFGRMVVEKAKAANPSAQFMWDVPFFNITIPTTDLSLALKSSDSSSTYKTSGSRPENDVAKARRLLIIDNEAGKGKIIDFEQDAFANEGDQAVEGFSPLSLPSVSSETTARLFLGIRPGGNELVVYCSRSASAAEASSALLAAGVPVENQLHGDGGLSTTCAYNLPGQYFVEPGRSLPHLMAAFPTVGRGKTTTDSLNVRSGAGTTHKVLRRLPLGEKFIIYEEKTGWVRISEKAEWVSTIYVQKI